MDLNKVKNGYREYDYEINALLGLNLGEKYIVVDENKEPYKICCGNNLDCDVYQSINERGEISSIKRKARCANDFIVESITGAKYKINLDKNKDALFETTINKNGTTMVSMSLICYAVSCGYHVLNCETLKALKGKSVVISMDAGIYNQFEEDYSINPIGKDFLCVDFHKINTNSIERFITNSNLVEYNDFDVSKMIKITPIDKFISKVDKGNDLTRENQHDKEFGEQFKECVRKQLNEEDTKCM